MTLVNKSVNNLINGVSQQSPAVRLDNQLEQQINCFSDVTKGLVIRNGFELVNVEQKDLTNTYKFEFTLDGQKYLMALNPDAVTPLQHIPLSADIDALTASIDNLSYFNGIRSNTLRVIEDKDKVYILNTNKKVGETELGTSYIDVEIRNDKNGLIDTSWDTGEYELTITAKESPSKPAATASKTITVTPSTLLTDIADLINGDSALVAETGTVFLAGSKSNYRITFESIPLDFITPIVSVSETVNITYSYPAIENDSGFKFNYVDPNNNKGSIKDGVNVQYGFNSFYYNETYIGFTTNGASLTAGGFVYERGSFYEQVEVPVYGGGTVTQTRYYIRRYQNVTKTDNFSIATITPQVGFSENTITDYAQRGLIWVTGVQQNQEYDVEITIAPYDDLETTTTQSISTVGVGTTVSNIKLNWVAGQVTSGVSGLTNLSATQYENAVLVEASGNYVITDITISNSFDNSSMYSAIEASIFNTDGVLDITSLPPTFIEGFKLRVGNAETEYSNYYMRYFQDFKGWKESGLDDNRVLDPVTMPQVIDKNRVRQTGEIVIEQLDWTTAEAGDDESNPSPTFVDKVITDMFFYNSRLGMATDDTIVMSKIDAPTTFYRTTCTKSITSDRVDIKLDSSKVGYDAIKHITTYGQKLFINTGRTQSNLLVNTAFDLTTARLSEVSSYSLGDNKPLPVENGLYFAISDDNYTNVYNYIATSDSTFDLENMTKHCPTYIDGTVDQMVYAKNTMILSVNEDRRSLYVQNRFSRGGEQLQNAFHKWSTPYDIEHIFFFNDYLYVLMSTEYDEDTYILTARYNLKAQDTTTLQQGASGINWTPYLDLYTTDKTLIENFTGFIGINSDTGTKFNTVSEAYDSTVIDQEVLGTPSVEQFDLLSPEFYWEVDGNTNTIVFDGGTPIVFGNNSITEFTSGGYRYYRGGDQGGGYYGVYRAAVTSSSIYQDNMVYGIPFTASVTLSKIIPRQETQSGSVVMNYANLMLRQMRLYLSKSGPFKVYVSFDNRESYEIVYNGAVIGTAVIGQTSAEDFTFRFPINGKSDLVTIRIESSSSTPFNLLSTEWQGQLITKGRNI